MSIPLLLLIQVSVRQQFNQRYSDLALLGHLFQGDTVLSQRYNLSALGFSPSGTCLKHL